jgi:hypothetical protein
MVILADSDYIKAYTYLNGSIGDDYLRVAMLSGQDKWISPYLGDSLYEYIKAQIQAGTVTGNYATLLNDYIKIAFAWWTVVEYLPNAMVKIDNSGLVQRSSDDTSAASRSDKEMLQTQARDNAEHYTQSLVRYLCANSTLFPEYSNNVYPQRCPITSNFKQLGMTVSHGHGRMVRDPRFNSVYRD